MALSTQSQLAFSEQLLTLLNAGLPLLNAVQLIQSSADKDSQPWLQEIQILPESTKPDTPQSV